jgi:DNA-binding transcriptional LysR family regulator
MVLQYIETFLAVARTKSISGAARELHCAQTTVSQRIKALETDLGYQVLERGKGIKEISFTPMGEEFYKLAEEWNRLEHEARLLKTKGNRLSLTIGAVDSINQFLLRDIIQNVNNDRQNLQLTIHTLHSVHLYSEVEKRQLDIAFSLQNRVQQNVNVEKCFTSPMVVLRSSLNNDHELEKIHPEELDSNYELFMPFGLEYQAWHAYWWDPLATSRIRIDSTHILLYLLQNPTQWAIIPKYIADEAMRNGSYKMYELTDPPPPYIVYKLTHKRPTSLTKKALEVLDYYFQSEYGETEKEASQKFKELMENL